MFSTSLLATRRAAAALVLALGATGCPDPEPEPEPAWRIVGAELPAALLAIGGTARDDVWAVGADKGAGPLVLHFDGTTWSVAPTGTRGTLWWVHALEGGPTFFGGANATILRWDGAAFERLPTPGVAAHTIFGVWGRAPDDLYAVGSVASRNGFIWHWDGTRFSEVALPDDIPTTNGDIPGFFKVWGDGHRVFVVGGRGVVLRADGGGPFERVPTDVAATLFTVHGTDGRCVIVGGGVEAVLLEEDGDALVAEPVADVTLLQGVAFGPAGEGYAVGERGAVLRAGHAGWEPVDTGLALDVQSLHATWIDPDGGVWAVGGNVLSAALDSGVIIHRGHGDAGTVAIEQPVTPAPVCPQGDVDPAPDRSIARRWNEQIIYAIRRDLPRPPVHARNLFHLSAAMWDAWAAYDPIADGVFVDEDHTADDVAAARHEAISYAAFRILEHRYSQALAVGAPVTQRCLVDFMGVLGLDPDDRTTTGDSPRAVGNRIGYTIIEATRDDGANEANNYADTTGWTSINPALRVEDATLRVDDPSVWQPLNLSESETQNGIPIGPGVQGYIGSNWNQVTPFAMTRADPSAPFHDPGPSPRFEDGEMNRWLVDIVEKHAALDPRLPATIDISPGAYGNNTLGSNDGDGHPENPVTGAPYARNVVKLGDFARVLAEYWADGPKSETPPGHWNVIANEGSETGGFARKLHGEGEPLAPLAWDVVMYLAINGAVHDAAITAWGIKRVSLGPRPITLIRWKASLGQSSEPASSHYHVHGLPLVPGVIELITDESSAPGERHAHLARYRGEVAVLSWRGEPGDRAHETSGVAWMRGVDWLPYQRRTFVTPAFPGFISGHSTFSRAAAEALAELTGSPYFPGGFAEARFAAHAYLVFEDGPSTDVALQWATYYDAADQAGQSRLWGGIHIEPDDLVGRALGSLVGADAYAKTRTYIEGSAR